MLEFLEKLGVYIATYQSVISRGISVIIKSDYRAIDEDSEYGEGIWLIPFNSRSTGNRTLHKCKIEQDFTFLIACVASCPSNTRNQIEVSMSPGGEYYLKGPLKDASEIFKIVRDAVADFAEETGEGVYLDGLDRDPVEHNNHSHLVLRLRTKIYI